MWCLTSRGATPPRAEHRRSGALLYVETDPVFEQIRAAQGKLKPWIFFPGMTCVSRMAKTWVKRIAQSRFLRTFPGTNPGLPLVLDLWKARVNIR